MLVFFDFYEGGPGDSNVIYLTQKQEQQLKDKKLIVWESEMDPEEEQKFKEILKQVKQKK